MIGLFDSGKGGLSCLARLKTLCPTADFVYFADEAHLPYGDKSPGELLSLGRAAAATLVSRGATAVLCACGTMSAVALPALQREFPAVRLSGVLRPTAARAVSLVKEKPGGIAILATRATIASGAFSDAIRVESAGFTTHAPLYPLACPAFVPLVERGETTTPAARATVREALAPLAGRDIGAVILGCTHFSSLAPLIAEALPGAALVDAAACGAEDLFARLTPAERHGDGRVELLGFPPGMTPVLS